MRKFLILVLLAQFGLRAEDPIEGAIKARDAEVEKAKAEFDAKAKVANDKLVVVLKGELTKLTQKGDLDGALKVKGMIEQAQGGKPIDAPKVAEAKGPSAADRIFTTKLDKSTFESGAKVYGNREYTVDSVPDKYKGWTAVRTNIKTNEPVILKLLASVTVLYIPHGRSMTPPAGFKDTGDKVTICEDADRIERSIYAKQVPAGALNLPASEGYALVIQTK